jgi:hypothetical protein
MDKEKLKMIMDKHRKWYLGKDGGKRADLQGADFRRADLQGADFRRADLRRANLRRANLQGAYLQGAYLRGACGDFETIIHNFKVAPEIGAFICFKKCVSNDKQYIAVLEVPADARRMNAISSRKIRVEKAKVLWFEDLGGNKIENDIESTGKNYPGIIYKQGIEVKSDKFDDNITIECSNGIHVFLTKQEAVEW